MVNIKKSERIETRDKNLEMYKDLVMLIINN